jgi:hypothetical protein
MRKSAELDTIWNVGGPLSVLLSAKNVSIVLWEFEGLNQIGTII